MLGMIPLSVPQQPSLVGNKLSFFFAGEEQNKEALQDVEDENQWDIKANKRNHLWPP